MLGEIPDGSVPDDVGPQQKKGMAQSETGGACYYIEDGVHRAVALRENGILKSDPCDSVYFR